MMAPTAIRARRAVCATLSRRTFLLPSELGVAGASMESASRMPYPCAVGRFLVAVGRVARTRDSRRLVPKKVNAPARNRTAPPPPEGLESGTMPAKKRLGPDDAQHVPPRWRNGRKCDQDNPVSPRQARPWHRTLQHRELASEQGHLGEHGPA